MKKTILLAAILVLALTACSANIAVPSEAVVSVQEPPSTPPASSAWTASESEPTSASSSKNEESSSSSAPKPASSSEAQQPSRQQAGSSSTEAAPQPTPAQLQTQPAPAQPQQQTPPPTDPAPQVEQPAPAPEPTPPPPQKPEPVPPPAPQTAYDAPYDIGVITADAQSYGASLGMTWSDSLNTGNCSWEAPISTSADLSGERLRAAIQSGINRVLSIQQDNGYQPGEFHFKVYLEASGGEYVIYFLMG